MSKRAGTARRVCVFLSLLLVAGMLLAALSLLAREDRTVPAEKDATADAETPESEEKTITYVDFTPTAAALRCALGIDLAWHEKSDPPGAGWIELLALYSARNGGDYGQFRESALRDLAAKIEGGADPATLTKNGDLYAYYLEAYHAALDGMVGEYTRVTVTQEDDGTLHETREACYGLRVFSPIAAGYYFHDYDDFGASRSYGYKRSHLGHDLLGSVGTPVIAVESGTVEHLGWNQYGGWRIGVRSFDGKRYYYYAHLRSGHPYADLAEGQIVHAGEVIGYLGMTGYSTKEDTNGISIPHLHLGLQLIFKPSQIDGWNQIWLDVYGLLRLWGQNRSETFLPAGGKDRRAKVYFEYPDEPD